MVAAGLSLRLEVMGVLKVDVFRAPGVLNKSAVWLSRRAESGKSGISGLNYLKGGDASPGQTGPAASSGFLCPWRGQRWWDSAS